MNQDDGVFLDPTELNETDPSGKNQSWQGDSISNRDKVDEGSGASLVNNDGVKEFLVRVSEDLLSISSKRNLSLEISETERLNSNLNFSRANRQRVGSSDRMVTVGVLQVSDVPDLYRPDTW